MVSIVPRIEFAHNFFGNLALTCCCSSNVVEGFLACLCTDILICSLVTNQECDLVGVTMHKLLPSLDVLSVNLDARSLMCMNFFPRPGLSRTKEVNYFTRSRAGILCGVPLPW
jgi:hypothetical protein